VTQRPFRLLVVDDIEHFRVALAENLIAPCREVVSASNIRLAMQHYAEQPFDLIVSDYSMPGGTGMDLLRQVRRIDPFQPFILMSADLPRAVAREAQLKGVRVFEKHDAMVQLPAAFLAEDEDPLQALFHSPAVGQPPASALTHGVA
jgi:DNA-binding NtrC family response regulator